MTNSKLFIIIFLLVVACSSPNKSADLLIKNATIVDVQSGKTESNKLVAISTTNIIAVDNSANAGDYTARKTINARGKFVMPGLWDMHVHFRGGDSLITENKNLLPLYLAYGVTTVRDCGGDITPTLMRWRNKIRNGSLDGPRIFTSGPKLDGANPAWPGSIRVTDEEDINHALDSLQQIGTDFVKLYDGSLTKEMYYGIIKKAHKRGMLITGHMPLSANILQAADYGLDGEEHMYYVLKSCSPKADSLTKLDIGYGMMDDLVDTYNPELADSVFNTLADHNFFVTPTLDVGQTLAQILVTNHQNDSLLTYIGSGIQQTYQGRINSAKRAGSGHTRQAGKLQAQFRRMIAPMQKAGINLLAGSDGGPYNSYVYPGQSLHEELHLLVKSGLTTQQALKTAVVNGPKFFGLTDSYGGIAPGKEADILILNKNPLENIDNTNSISTVISRGKVYTREKLQQMLNDIKHS